MDEIVIVGYGGHGRETAWLAQDCGYSVLGFLDDCVAPGAYGAYRVLGAVDDWTNYSAAQFVVAIGNPRVRKQVVMSMLARGEPAFATLIHPSVIRSDSVSVGKGVAICAGTVMTVDISVGDHAIVNTKCSIAHDDDIGAFVTLAPQATLSGNVTLEDGVEVGAAAALRQGVIMGSGSMLGMGGVLTHAAEAKTLYVGVPAKAKRQLPDF